MANSITNPVDNYTPEELFVTETPPTTAPRQLKSGQNVVARTVLMSDAAGLLVAHDGDLAKKVAGISVYAVDATAAQKAISVYTRADMYADKVTFPAASTTNDLKAALFDGTGLTARFNQGGY